MVNMIIFCLIFLLGYTIANIITRVLNIKFPEIFNFILSPFWRD